MAADRLAEHRHEVDVVGAKVNYVEMGEGPPLLFVHGLSGAWQNFLENIPYFARTHRVIAVDLPGFGSSPMPPWEISIPAYGRFLRDFCERLGVDRCSLVGNSMGGFIATEVAITEPDRVDDLVLISAAGITWARARREPAAVIARVGRAAAPLATRFHMSWIRRPGLRKEIFQGVFFDPNALRREMLWENVVPALQSPGYYDAMTTLWGYDIRHRLEEIERADIDRVGPERSRRARSRGPLLQEAHRRQRRAGHLRPLRPRPPDRAAGALQPPARGVPGAPEPWKRS